MSDVEALDWLDRLLAADEPQRRASLATLEQDDPELHARLERLLVNALAPGNSRVLAAPVLDGVAPDPTFALARLRSPRRAPDTKWA